MWNGFYSLKHLTKDELKCFFKDAVKLSYQNNIQKIVSRLREVTDDYTVDYYIDNIVETNHHNVCVDRYLYHKAEYNKYGEIGSSTIINNISYLLYIFVELKDLYSLIEKYNLKKPKL